MKKLLTLIFISLLCFAVSCEKPEEKPVETPTDTPEVTEPAETPTETPEVTEPVETPTETPEITEPVETPTETPEVVEPVETPEENVIILPEPDENTVTIEIAFPEDFPEETYQEPDFVSPEEFEWGEYVPFVSYGASCIGEFPGMIYGYSFLGEGITSIEEGNKIYQKLNNKFLIKQKAAENLTCFSLPAENYDGLLEFIYGSSIIYVSQDASSFVRVSFTDTLENREKNITYENFTYGFKGLFEVIKDGKIICSKEIDNIEIFRVRDYFFKGTNFEQKYVSPFENENLTDNNYIYDESTSTLYVYDSFRQKLLYEIILKENIIFQDFANNKLLFRVYENENGIHKTRHFVYDCNNGEFTFIAREEYAPLKNAMEIGGILISPDGKYIVYKYVEAVYPDGKVPSSKCKFIIKNIITNETTYYDYNLKTDDEYFDFGKLFAFNTINFVNRKALNEIIKE